MGHKINIFYPVLFFSKYLKSISHLFHIYAKNANVTFSNLSWVLNK